MIPELDLNEDERDLLAGARKFAQEVMLPRGKEAFESGEVPIDVLVAPVLYALMRNAPMPLFV